MNRRFQADLALTFCMVIWGATFVVVKDALRDASVFSFIAVRFTVAALLMALLFRASLRRLATPTLRAGALLGFFMFSGYVFQTLGLKLTTPSKAAFINGSSTIMVPILLAAFWRRRVNGWVWTGALAALAGLYLLSVPPAGFARLSAGDVLALVGALAFAVHIIMAAHFTARHSLGALSFLQVAMMAILASAALPLLAATGWEPPRFEVTPNLLWAIGITAVGATAIAFSLQLWAQQRTSPTHAAILFTLEPVFAAITSYFVAHERLGGRSLSGAALILAGILCAELKGPAPVAPESSVATSGSGEEET